MGIVLQISGSKFVHNEIHSTRGLFTDCHDATQVPTDEVLRVMNQADMLGSHLRMATEKYGEHGEQIVKGEHDRTVHCKTAILVELLPSAKETTRSTGQNCLVPFLHGMATLIGRSSKNPLQLIKRNLYRRRTIHVNSCHLNFSRCWILRVYGFHIPDAHRM